MSQTEHAREQAAEQAAEQAMSTTERREAVVRALAAFEHAVRAHQSSCYEPDRERRAAALSAAQDAVLALLDGEVGREVRVAVERVHIAERAVYALPQSRDRDAAVTSLQAALAAIRAARPEGEEVGPG